ncbi:DgyrCDS9963 [Dimorphilus gyrociliatus]|uniref:DgyrCDS9963 n=1 Tax=Dimorphilus gyrociliatus TaxID=2664684 RepID=A0A7I8VYQ2_9ANNE|nr:DgyrCDS9963 [Dimorphilus gyrociliatus]
MSGSSSQNPTGKIYQSVIDDVINNVREAFQDEGYDENVLHELRQLWEGKLKKSKVVEFSGTETKSAPVYLQSVIQPGTQQTVYPTLTTSGQAGASAAMQIPVSLSQNLIQINGQNFLIQSGSQNLMVGQNNQQNRINQVDGTADDESGKGSDDETLPSKSQITEHKARRKGKKVEIIIQHDGANDSSSSSDSNSSDESEKDEEEEEQGEEEKSLNSGDDVSEEDTGSLFEVDNLVVCLYDKINRNKTKWKFTLKDGIMNLKGKDYVFQKATGDADW